LNAVQRINPMKGIILFGGGSDMPGGFVSPDMLK
jgi:hypothetical protein